MSTGSVSSQFVLNFVAAAVQICPLVRSVRSTQLCVYTGSHDFLCFSQPRSDSIPNPHAGAGRKRKYRPTVSRGDLKFACNIPALSIAILSEFGLRLVTTKEFLGPQLSFLADGLNDRI
jgi:hypothetical protein